MAQHPQSVQAATNHDPESNSESRAAREAQLLDLLDQTSELICTSDPTGRITYANSTWLRTLGYSMDEARQLRPADLVAPEHRSDYLDVARRVNRGVTIRRSLAQRYLDCPGGLQRYTLGLRTAPRIPPIPTCPNMALLVIAALVTFVVAIGIAVRSESRELRLQQDAWLASERARLDAIPRPPIAEEERHA